MLMMNEEFNSFSILGVKWPDINNKPISFIDQSLRGGELYEIAKPSTNNDGELFLLKRSDACIPQNMTHLQQQKLLPTSPIPLSLDNVLQDHVLVQSSSTPTHVFVRNDGALRFCSRLPLAQNS